MIINKVHEDEVKTHKEAEWQEKHSDYVFLHKAIVEVNDFLDWLSFKESQVVSCSENIKEGIELSIFILVNLRHVNELQSYSSFYWFLHKEFVLDVFIFKP